MTARNCPICAVALAPEAYEGLQILRCPQCQGHLLDLARYESIQRLPEKTIAALEAEAQAGFQGDNPVPIRCPRCHMLMGKQAIPIPGHALNLDFCRGCAIVWLDGGELALAQLAYQASPAFRNIQEIKQRAAELAADPERKAAFDEAVARLPETADPFKDGLHITIWDILLSHPCHYGIRL